jgi:hypothetical protein
MSDTVISNEKTDRGRIVGTAQWFQLEPGDSEEELKGLAELVLCPGHARGKLPQLYSETWSVFAAKRLPKEEAMSRFDLEQWMSVQFFNDHNTLQTGLRKTKSTFNLPQTQFERVDYLSLDREKPTPSCPPQPKNCPKRNSLILF